MKKVTNKLLFGGLAILLIAGLAFVLTLALNAKEDSSWLQEQIYDDYMDNVPEVDTTEAIPDSLLYF